MKTLHYNYQYFVRKYWTQNIFKKLNNVSQIRQTFINLSRLMSELCSFKFLKLYLLNCAIVHAQIEIVMLIKIGHNLVA